MNLTFEQVVQEYLEYSKINKKFNTYQTLERRIKKHIRPFFKDYKMIDINAKEYLKWQVSINELGFSFNYKSSLHYAMSDIFEYCKKFYEIKNIAQIVGNFKNQEIKEKGNIWSIEEFKKFINNVDDITYKTLFDLFYFTGLRKGEALALTFNDLNGQYLTINKTMTRYTKNGKRLITPPKTLSSNRIISLDNNLIQEINELKEFYKKKYENFNDNYYIFGGENEITFTTLLRKKNYYCKKANVKQIKIHEIRHSHAVLLYLNNVPIDEISHRLGHSKISMTTDIYLKYIPVKEKKCLDTLNTLHSF